jgi:cardiolipin synthase
MLLENHMLRSPQQRKALLHRLLHILKRAALAFLALEATVMSVLVAIGAWRKHAQQHREVPAMQPQPLTIGDAEVQVYTYGAYLYDAMLDAIRHAERRILLDMFIWKGDRAGKQFKAELERAAERGVEVYVIFDSFANLIVPPSFKRFPPTIHALKFRVAPKPWQMLSPRNYGRDHHKILVVDGKVGFTGGYNIGAPYATEWRDTSVRLTGAKVWDLENVFIDFWNMHVGPGRPQLVTSRTPQWTSEIRVQRNVPQMLMFPIRSVYVEAIDRAQHHIYLTHAYFIPDRTIVRSLIAAAQRGVDVRLLVPETSNHTLADWLARGFYTQLLTGGIKLLRYQPAMLHAKTATIDGVWSTIGTANIDRLSLQGNYELNVEFFDTALAQQMEAIFAADAADAGQLTLEEWRQRPLIARFSEALLSPLWPLL